MLGEKELDPQRPGLCSSELVHKDSSFLQHHGQSLRREKCIHGQEWEKRGPARRGWKQAGLLYSPVGAGQLVGGRRRDERSAAVPVAGVSAARQRRRHLQQRHVGRGQVRALAGPRAVRGRAGPGGLGQRLGGRWLRAGSGEEPGLRGGAQRDVRRGAEGPCGESCLLGGDQGRGLRGEPGGTVGRSSEVGVLMML